MPRSVHCQVPERRPLVTLSAVLRAKIQHPDALVAARSLGQSAI